ncbi:unnamed protein product [Musa acuminata subsp. malaccensis]|uniref:(wild Malaysian banana) hypothetical protein n=1 Tax=Musa acuminata subsp. malaccensis TaxID=214687 RepID=A0A804K1E3_MUSAM|nr:unnamed protein product [Musa acuminata subsp. malaccensis]
MSFHTYKLSLTCSARTPDPRAGLAFLRTLSPRIPVCSRHQPFHRFWGSSSASYLRRSWPRTQVIGEDVGRVWGSEGVGGVQLGLGHLREGGSHLSGPVSTPYKGGTFHIDIRLPIDYSFEPPKMWFRTKVCHPNISSQHGAICFDIRKDQWSPAFTSKIALLSPQALLSAPEPDDPKDAVVAQQYLRDHPANTIGEQLLASKKRYKQ